jgi:Raf kinase inhibitor-like YbhB/YbcL family protein
MVIASSAFKNGERIPSQHTCDGEDTSPPLSWSGFPNETRTFAILVDDPDAPGGAFTHWVIFNIPATENGLQEDIPTTETILNGVLQGTNGFGKIGYGGPCPPSGTHHYVFHLYSLDAALSLPVGATKEDVVRAMNGHILAEAELTGLYARG